MAELRRCNGNAGDPPEGKFVVWGLRSTSSGRWINNADKFGVESLQVFRTRELASQFKRDGNEVVWMTAPRWWQKVSDAAKTRHPTQVLALTGIHDGRTEELIYDVATLVASDREIDDLVAEILTELADDQNGMEGRKPRPR